jgi:hypothetical protein
MKRISLFTCLACVGMLALALPASADFSGQIILGPIGLGSVVNGDTTGASDDNDGITSGMHIWDVWTGPDDVWQINWTGGDLALEMTYNNALCDLDLFLYTPTSYDDSGNFSILNSGVENILEPAAATGTYYVLVDAPNSDAGAYTLSVTPEPASLALLGLGLAVIARRR